MTEKESLQDIIELGFYRINTPTSGEKLTRACSHYVKGYKYRQEK